MSRFTDTLNAQVASEFGASQQYIAIAVHYDAQSLPQLAAHFYRQAVEERNHAMMIVQYLLDADALVAIPGVAAPQTAFDDDRAPVALALEQEKTVTAQIANLVQIAREDNEYVGEQFLGWFLDEQREEVASMSTLLVRDRPRRRRQPAPRRGLPQPRCRRNRGRTVRPDAACGRRRALAHAVDTVGGTGESRELQLDERATDLRRVEVRAARQLVCARRRVAKQREQLRRRPLDA